MLGERGCKGRERSYDYEFMEAVTEVQCDSNKKISHKNNLKLLYFLSLLAQYLQNCFINKNIFLGKDYRSIDI